MIEHVGPFLGNIEHGLKIEEDLSEHESKMLVKMTEILKESKKRSSFLKIFTKKTLLTEKGGVRNNLQKTEPKQIIKDNPLFGLGVVLVASCS